VVILDVPDPSTSQIDRFYTREFFAEVRRAMLPGGVMSIALAHEYEGYLSPEMARVLATLHRTLRAVFANVLLIPGGKIYLLASDGELTGDVAGRLEAAGIPTRWVNRAYLAAMLTPGRTAGLQRALAADGPVNRDFSPILYYYQLRYWMSQFRFRFGLLEGALLVLLAAYLVRLRPVPTAVFATGFAASALEVVLLFGFQILYGSVYRQMGLIVTMFMLGLGIGSLGMTRALPRRGRASLVWLLAALALYAACLPLALVGLGRLGAEMTPAASEVAVPLLTLLLAVLVGMAFPLAAKLDFQGIAATASRLYTADYVGACLGALLVSTLLIPLLGVATVCLLTAGLAIWSAGLLTVTSR
jgi:spermidine synthase